MSPPRPEPEPPPPADAVPAMTARLQYSLGPGAQRGAAIDNPLFDLLRAVHGTGSISQAIEVLGCSYRYAWGALKQWEATLGEPLILWIRGQRAQLTPFAERLLWAEQRARTRMQPHIEALRADLNRMLAEARDDQQQLLTVHASHDLALPLLQQHAQSQAALHLNIRFQGSVDCLRALNAGRCAVAGFHVPALRGAAPVFSKALKPLLKPGTHKLIGCSRRRQGLMLRREHAKLVAGLPDIGRLSLRFVNRQVGSGTRMLVDHLLHEHAIDLAALPGYGDHVEETHVAVAACIASGLADVGVGVEAAALEFGLHFVPLMDEEYFLVCLKPRLADPAVRRLCDLLAGTAWTELLAGLPGYAPASAPGAVLRMTVALPWWRYTRPRPAPTAQGLTQDPLQPDLAQVTTIPSAAA